MDNALDYHPFSPNRFMRTVMEALHGQSVGLIRNAKGL